MHTIRFIVFALTLIAFQAAGAQRVQRLGIAPHAASQSAVSFVKKSAALPGNSGMPGWVRWGLVGAVGGAALFALADGLGNGSRSTGSNILAGAVTGFVVVGGGVLVYDAICSPNSGSRRSGFCGR